jgi:hypothetical protein
VTDRPPDEPDWLERPRTIRRLWLAFAVALAITLGLGAFVPLHGRFGIDGVFGFNAWYGFLTCVALVLVARLLGALLKRPDRYYGD